MLVAELLEKPEAWTQGVFAKTEDGKSVMPRDPGAVCFCLWGAMVRCYPDEDQYEAAYWRLKEVLGEESRATFNDTHTHAEVLDAVRRAGI